MYRAIAPAAMSSRPCSGDDGLSAGSQGCQSLSDSASRSNPPNTTSAEPECTPIKRRRVPDSVTRNACLRCKKSRAKCDGKKPCRRCSSRIDTTECIYESHTRHAKKELVDQIKDLKTKERLADQIIQALCTEDQALETLSRLRSGETYEAIGSWLGGSFLEEDGEFELDTSQQSVFDSQFDPHSPDMDNANSTASQWTSVTSDTAILDHLFQLYFAWVHPVHTLFSEGHFVDSYQRHSRLYCSTILVDAICAMACHLHSTPGKEGVDFAQLGREFSDAVRSGIDSEDATITTIQAFAIMYLVDSARTDALRAASYLKIATAILSKKGYLGVDDGSREVWIQTSRGLQNLNSEWAQATFQVPSTVQHSHFGNIDHDEVKLDEAKWYFYRQRHTHCVAWPGLLGITNRQKSKLVSIIHDVTTRMYTPNSAPIQARHILDYYSRFVAWRTELPGSIRNVETNSNQALPHVLSLLILYEDAIVHLLRPLMDLDGFPVPTIEETIWRHTQSGLRLLDEHYRAQYTCRFQPVLQMFAVLHFADVVVRYFPGRVQGCGKDGPSAIRFGLESLAQSQEGFPVAGTLLKMLRKTARESGIRWDDSQFRERRRQSSARSYRIDDIVDACARHSYVPPGGEMRSRYSSTFCADWKADAAAFGFHEPPLGARRLSPRSADEGGSHSPMQVRNLLNTN